MSARLFLTAVSVCLATGIANAGSLSIKHVMTICSVPSTDPDYVVERLLGEGFDRAPLPLDEKTTQNLALIELSATWQPARLKASSPQADWDEFREAFEQYAAGYAARLAEPGMTLLIAPETGALLLIRTRNEPTSMTLCMLGVPQSIAVSSNNFPRLAKPRQPDLFAVEATSSEFLASQMTLQEVVVAFDTAAVGERMGTNFDSAAVFSMMVVVPEWAVAP
jgi:hypothetical protein